MELSDLGGWIKIRTHGTALLKRKGSDMILKVYRYRKAHFQGGQKNVCIFKIACYTPDRSRKAIKLNIIVELFTVLSTIKYMFYLLQYCILWRLKSFSNIKNTYFVLTWRRHLKKRQSCSGWQGDAYPKWRKIQLIVIAQSIHWSFGADNIYIIYSNIFYVVHPKSNWIK